MDQNNQVNQPVSQPLNPPPIPVAYVPPANPSKLPILILALLFILALTAAIYLFIQNQNLKTSQTASIPQPTAIAVPTANPTVDPTAEWKTCTNSLHNFTIKYPSDYDIAQDCSYSPAFEKVKNLNTVEPLIKDYVITFTYTQTGLSEEDPTLEWIRKNLCIQSNPSSCSEIVPGPIPDSFQVDLLGRHYASTDTVFRRGTTILDISLAARNPNTSIDTDAKKNYNQILSTFRFLDQPTPPAASPSLTKIKILDTSSWTEYQCGGIRFKIPADTYKYLCPDYLDGSKDVLISKIDSTFVGATIQIRNYDGGSRRQYWITAIKASPDEVSRYIRFQESLFGTVAGLDVFGSGGWWQGGYASPILIAHDTTIVLIFGGRDFNDQTGKITRSDFTDTLASTIKFP
jgi:hypothetical protein